MTGKPWEKSWSVAPAESSAPKSEAVKPREKKWEAPPSAGGELAKDLGKGALGVAVGAGEALNPLSVPNQLFELAKQFPLTRAKLAEPNFLFGERKPDESLWGKAKRVYQEAGDTPNPFPAMRVEDVAPVIRAGVRAPFNEAGFSDILKSEQASQKSFNADIAPEGARNAGEVGTGVIGLLLGLKSALKVGGAGRALKTAASSKAYDSLKPTGKLSKDISIQKRNEVIGKQLLDDKIVSPGVSFKTIEKRIETKLNDYGEKIGYYVKTADKARSKDYSIPGVSVDDFASAARSELIKPLLNDPSTTHIARQVANWVRKVRVISQNEDVSFSQAQAWKTSLGKTKAKFKVAGDDLSSGAFDDLYGILNTHIENGIQGAFLKVDPKMADGFVKAKNSYRNLMDAKKLIASTVTRFNNNRTISPSDYATILGGSIAGSAAGGPLGAAAGVPLGILNHLARTRGNQTSASGLRGLAGFIENNMNVLPKNIGNLFPKSVRGGAEIKGLLNSIAPTKEKK